MTNVKVDCYQSQLQELQRLYSSTRREHLATDLIPQLTSLKSSLSTTLIHQKGIYHNAKTAYEDQYPLLSRLLQSKSSRSSKKDVSERQKAYKHTEWFLKQITKLYDDVKAECAMVEIRDTFEAGICGVYNPLTGKVEWRKSWHGSICGVFNPHLGVIEWNEAWKEGVNGVYNPRSRRVEWWTCWHGGVYGVWNPKLGCIEWMEKWHHGVCGVWNPVKECIEWNLMHQGAVIGWFDWESKSVVWMEKFRHGLGAIVRDRDGAYLSVTSSGWFDED